MKTNGKFWVNDGSTVRMVPQYVIKEKRVIRGFFCHFIVLVGILCPLFRTARADGPLVFWEKTFGGSNRENGLSVQQTTDGGYIIGGQAASYVGWNHWDVYLVKTDPNGVLKWEKKFGDTDNDGGRSVQQTSDGGYIIAGWTWSYGAGYVDVYLVKTDFAGDIEWQKTFGGYNYDEGYSVQQTSDGGYIIVGWTLSYGAGHVDIYLIKTYSNGVKQWEKTFGGSNMDEGLSVQQTIDGGYIIVGSTQSYGAGNSDVYLIKTKPNGNSQWQKTFGGSDWDEGSSIQQTTDGGYIICGSTESDGAGGKDVYVIKTDPNGDMEWQTTFGGGSHDSGHSVQQTTDGGYIIAGTTESYGAGRSDVYLIKTDPNGNSLWEKTIGGNDADCGYSVQQTSEGGYIIVGATESYSAGLADVYLIKVGSDADRDGDGLYDIWETDGIDINQDSIVDLDLSALGADPNHKDLFVEVDELAGQSFPQAARNMVIAAFADAPVMNPDGNSGIALHVIMDEDNVVSSSPWTVGPDKWPVEFDPLKQAHFGTVSERSNEHILAAKRRAFRYCIIADTLNTSWAGIGECPGNDFLLALGNLVMPTESDWAGVFMHELGHTLGLRHGGGDSINGKPNYISVMNYLLMIPYGFASGFWSLDYSRTQLDPLDEKWLDETVGITEVGVGSVLYPGVKMPYGVDDSMGGRKIEFAKLDGSPIDWNNDGNSTDTVAEQDINYHLGPPTFGPSPGTIMPGHNDWANLKYAIGTTGHFAKGVHVGPPEGEITVELLEWIDRAIPGPCYSDLSEDGEVNFKDFAILVQYWLEVGSLVDISQPPYGTIDMRDLQVLCDEWLAKCR
jgi:regulation of enolase protein 1 (concanavalin A-like superfamily)